MPRRKKERGRPQEGRYPPRIDAKPERIAAVALNAKPRGGARFGGAPKRTEYRCQDCGQQVSYPDTLFDDGRCKECHAIHA